MGTGRGHGDRRGSWGQEEEKGLVGGDGDSGDNGDVSPRSTEGGDTGTAGTSSTKGRGDIGAVGTRRDKATGCRPPQEPPEPSWDREQQQGGGEGAGEVTVAWGQRERGTKGQKGTRRALTVPWHGGRPCRAALSVEDGAGNCEEEERRRRHPRSPRRGDSEGGRLWGRSHPSSSCGPAGPASAS